MVLYRYEWFKLIHIMILLLRLKLLKIDYFEIVDFSYNNRDVNLCNHENQSVPMERLSANNVLEHVKHLRPVGKPRTLTSAGNTQQRQSHMWRHAIIQNNKISSCGHTIHILYL